LESWFLPGVEENGVKCLYPGGDSFLQVGVCCISLASQVLLKGPKELKITEGADKAVGWVSITTNQTAITILKTLLTVVSTESE
jgi:hypothetical protein